MSIYARIRLLLAVSVLLVGASVWLLAGQQRAAVVGMQSQLNTSSGLLTSMLDQETGLRGFALTDREVFLEPYQMGQDQFERVLSRATWSSRSDPVAAGMVRDLTSTARQWQANASTAVDQVRRRGAGAISVEELVSRKQLMDRYRAQLATYRDRLERHARDGLQHARYLAVASVVLFGTMALGLGMLAVERTARVDARRRRQHAEFTEALQGAVDEVEAKELLRGQAERLVNGADAVVLTRNASGNSLDATTDPSALPGLPEALLGATPRSCLAIRRGRTYERAAGEQPLQACELCSGLPGASMCVPSLVGGEVIGTVLAVKHGALKEVERAGLAGAVTQAAPVLANLRNLAIAEHRAATDQLTKLPNARTVQETLIRMVAQAQRSGDPLAAVVVDLDHFKAHNDRHGHQAGDEVLQAVGAALRRGVRMSDFAGRWGGEEFLLLLPGTDLDGAALVAENLRRALDGLHVPGVTAHVTASLGVATLPLHAEDGPGLVRAADRALYAAKAAGRNQVMLATAGVATVAAD